MHKVKLDVGTKNLTIGCCKPYMTSDDINKMLMYLNSKLDDYQRMDKSLVGNVDSQIFTIKLLIIDLKIELKRLMKGSDNNG